MKMKLIISGIMLTLLCLLGGCDDKLEVQQAYDFSLTSWYLQKTISPDETVEIRLNSIVAETMRKPAIKSVIYRWRAAARCTTRRRSIW